MRGLVSTGLVGDGDTDVNFMWEIPNRGKKGLGIDLAMPEGQQLVHELAATCDVFLTSFLTDARKRLRIDVDDIRAVNPRIVYARGTGQGTKGAEAETGGFDGTVYWGRSGMAIASSPPSVPLPLPMPSPGFGDLMSGLVLAAGIATGAVPSRAHRRGADRRRLAPRCRDVADEPEHHRRRALRSARTEAVRSRHPPRAGGQPGGEHLPHEGRPVRPARVPPERPALARAVRRRSAATTWSPIPVSRPPTPAPPTASNARRSSTASSRPARSRSGDRSSTRPRASGRPSRRRRRSSTIRKPSPTATCAPSRRPEDRSRSSRTRSCSTRRNPTSNARRRWASTPTRRCRSSATTRTRSST